MDMNKIEKAFQFVLDKIDKDIDKFTDKFPGEQSENYVYQQTDNWSWTESFYTGMIWLSYEITKNDKYLSVAKRHLKSFKDRIDNKVNIDHHDLGFLYTLSCVAGYKLTGDAEAKETALKAADTLITRFQEKGQFIQAWGELGAADNYRLIIDCLLNLPLLFWATEVTGNNKYADIAKKHLKTALSVVLREDGTTHHTYFFDMETGAPLKGVTHQGYSDTSCWARGQAWGVYGTALAYAYTKDEEVLKVYRKITDCFVSKLPKDNVPFWDMDFTDGDDQPRDTSAAAIALCGILEMDKYIKEPKYTECAEKMMESLIDNYLTEDYSNGILSDAMYNRNGGHQPECNIWGDYYFTEAIVRYKNPDWKMYW